MSFISELIEYIENETSFNVGTNLFKNGMPPTPTEAIAFWNTPIGSADRELPTYESILRCESRAMTKSTAEINWKTIFDLLNRRSDYDLTSFHVFTSTGLTAEPYLAEDEKDRKIYVSMFKFEYREKD